jgi:hypothetical protein
LPNYTFEVDEGIILTGKFVEMPKVNLEVTIDGNGSVSLDGAEITPGGTEQIYRGSQIQLTAQADNEYEFAYWQDIGSGSIISFTPTYECRMGTDIHIKAVFKKTVTEETTHFTVTFVDKGGNILHSQEVAKDGAASSPKKDPVLPGYTFTGWDKNFDSVTGDLIINPCYQREEGEYTVTVAGGTLSTGGNTGSFKFDMPVTIEADPAPEGQRFSHWTQGGVKVSTKRSYSFFTPMKNTTLKAEYVDENAPVVNVPFITLGTLEDTGEPISYTVHRDAPADYTLVQSGVILYQGDLTGELTINTSSAIIGRISNSSTDQFYTYKNIKQGETWIARAYLIYQDENGNIVTVYNEQL